MSKFTHLPKKLLAACTFAAAIACGSASAAPLFQVQEGAVGAPTVSNLFTADRLTFGYDARIIQTIVGGDLAGADDPFTMNGFLNKASFELGAGNALSTQLNAFGDGGYKIYGVFTITGEADPLGGGILATANSLSLTLYLDPDADTLLGFDGGNNVTIGGGTGDDGALATFSMISAEAHIFGGLANGDFDSLLNITLTALGASFFVDPDPFYLIENFGGNIQTLSGASLTDSFVGIATGAGVELFLIPEPGMLSLFGLAILGMGAVSRRQRKNS